MKLEVTLKDLIRCYDCTVFREIRPKDVMVLFPCIMFTSFAGKQGITEIVNIRKLYIFQSSFSNSPWTHFLLHRALVFYYSEMVIVNCI